MLQGTFSQCLLNRYGSLDATQSLWNKVHKSCQICLRYKTIIKLMRPDLNSAKAEIPDQLQLCLGVLTLWSCILAKSETTYTKFAAPFLWGDNLHWLDLGNGYNDWCLEMLMWENSVNYTLSLNLNNVSLSPVILFFF